MPSTTVPDTHRDLTRAPIASLTTLDRHGAPAATLVWFAYDETDERFKLSLATDRAKTKNLLARPQVSLMIPDPGNPMRFIDVRGGARTEPDPDMAWAIAHVNPKYDADVRHFPGDERLVVTIEPTQIYAAALG